MKAPHLLLALSILLAGCATPKLPISAPVAPLVFPEAYHATSRHGLRYPVTLPAGPYRAVFRDQTGTYFKPEAEVLVRGGPLEGAHLYVPDEPSAPVGLWISETRKVDPLEPARTIASLTK